MAFTFSCDFCQEPIPADNYWILDPSKPLTEQPGFCEGCFITVWIVQVLEGAGITLETLQEKP